MADQEDKARQGVSPVYEEESETSEKNDDSPVGSPSGQPSGAKDDGYMERIMKSLTKAVELNNKLYKDLTAKNRYVELCFKSKRKIFVDGSEG